METRKPGLVTFGLGGHTVYMTIERTATGSNSSRIEGYDNPESFEKRLSNGKAENYGDLAGVPVVDGRPAYASENGISLAMSGPMVEPGIEAPERFSDIQGVSESLVLSAFRDHGDDTQRGLARLADLAIENDSFSGLDKLPVPLYLAWCAKHLVPHGARIGRISDDGRSIIWT